MQGSKDLENYFWYDAVRLFVGCELEEALRARLAEVGRRAGLSADGLRWTAPEAMHVTLKFLGEVEEALVGEVTSVLEEPLGDVPAFAVLFQGLGRFPPRGAPRVLWAGISEGAAELISLSRIVESAMEAVGFEREKRVFLPHVTLARVKRDARPRGVGELVREGKATTFGSQEIRYVSLIRSVLGPDGAVYTPVHKWVLRGN